MLGRHAVLALEFPDATVPLSPRDIVVLAVPPWVAKDMAPGLVVPTEFRAIVNAHFQFTPPKGTPPILGVINGTVEWVFSFDDRISVTVSGADAIVDRDREELALVLWRDVCQALRISADLPKWQVVKEKRATLRRHAGGRHQAPAPRKRPGAIWCWRASWTDTGLPATLEGAVRSGETAAALALRRLAL